MQRAVKAALSGEGATQASRARVAHPDFLFQRGRSVSTARHDSSAPAARNVLRWPSRATSNANDIDRSVTDEYVAEGLAELEAFANSNVLVAA